MSNTLDQQAARLYGVLAELARAYQFRDREQVCWQGMSISQCYALETIYMHGAMTMSELATCLYVDLSTMTRIIDALAKGGLATRVEDAKDRRVCRVQMTRKGRSLITQSRSELVKEHKAVLRQVPAESREAVISAMGYLLTAFKERQQSICASGKSKQVRKQKAG